MLKAASNLFGNLFGTSKMKVKVDKDYKDTRNQILSNEYETVVMSVTITTEQMHKARKLGNGNRSLGIRRALDLIEVEE